MNPMKLALVAALLVAGCDGNPFGVTIIDPTPDPGDENGQQLAGSLGSAALSGGNLEITLVPFDAPPLTAVFTRAPALDVSGYQAFVPVANPAVNRNYVAFVAQIDGAISVVVGDGGRNVDAFGGTGVSRTGGFIAPTSGLATYRGDYVGLRTRGDGSTTALNPDIITGTVEIQADFTDGNVEGSISDRTNTRAGLTAQERVLDDRFLKVTTIEDDGTFNGEVASPLDTVVGAYTGVFAGNGQSVAGAVSIDEANPSGFQDDVTEYGIFALPCVVDDTAGAVCN